MILCKSLDWEILHKKPTHVVFLKERGQIETLNYEPRGDVQILLYFYKKKLQIVAGNAVIRRMSEEDGGQTDTGETKVGW